MAALRRLHRVGAALRSPAGLDETMQAVVDGVVDALGFGVAVANVRQADGSFRVIAAAGPDDVRDTLLGHVSTAGSFEEEFAAAEEWGLLRFVPHDALPEGATGWVPDLEVSDEPDAWHPLDALFAPLQGADGELLGILSVDLPHDGRRPGATQRELLELFAVQAGLAVEGARLRERLLAERSELALERVRLAESESAFRLAFEGASNGMAIVRLDAPALGVLVRVNAEYARILGAPPQDLPGRTAERVLHPEDHARALAALQAVSSGRREAAREDLRVVHPDGRTAWVRFRCSALSPGGDGRRFGLITAEDVTSEREREARLRHRADHDALTGLPNRPLLLRRLEAAARQAAATTRPGAVLFCDLDGFKQVNDLHGHAAGDAVLREVARRLLGEVRAHDTVARLGGDEFVVVAEDLDDEGVARVVARLRSAVAQPLEGLPERVTLSVGVARLTGEAAAADLLAEADAAMYRAKRGRVAEGATG
ncbi:diguanylate cyclase [Vallicoccus soli]|uniref:Diguanylate cyclase n=1 Tax=Vallicoccus soli TaxID=2339232 RepID=A0A3A3YZH3_9ACTN|nr:diguanylate cyclase [Vallicoccus soli]